MRFVDTIFSLVWDIAWFFNDLAYEARDIPIVGHILGSIFFAIFKAFWNLTTPIAQFGDWVQDVTDKISQVFDIETIKALLKEWLDWAEWSWSWIQDAWYYVTGWIDDWWLSTQNTVKGWIDIATQGFNDLVVAWDNFWNITWPELFNIVNNLSAAWDDFWVNIFPTLVSFSWLTTWWISRVQDVQDLINSAFTLRESLWAGWQEIREQVFEFFTDPWSWLYNRFDDFIERFF